MRRYDVPRLAFINKCDRAGANPWKARCCQPTPVSRACRPGWTAFSLHTAAGGEVSKLAGWRRAQVIEQMRAKLRLLCAPVQLPMGLEEEHKGLVDLIRMKAFIFEGPNGETIKEVCSAASPAKRPLTAWKGVRASISVWSLLSLLKQVNVYIESGCCAGAHVAGSGGGGGAAAPRAGGDCGQRGRAAGGAVSVGGAHRRAHAARGSAARHRELPAQLSLYIFRLLHGAPVSVNYQLIPYS